MTDEIKKSALFPEKKIIALTRTEKKAIIVEALNAAGYNDNETSRLIEVSRQHVHQIKTGIKKGTLNPLVHQAKKSVKSLLKGMPVGLMSEVKGSDVLTAAKMVLDRTDPVVNKVENTSVRVTYDLRPEDRERFTKMLGLPVIDAQFEPAPEIKQIENTKEE